MIPQDQVGGAQFACGLSWEQAWLHSSANGLCHGWRCRKNLRLPPVRMPQEQRFKHFSYSNHRDHREGAPLHKTTHITLSNRKKSLDTCDGYKGPTFKAHLFLIANIVTTSKAPVTTSVALVTRSDAQAASKLHRLTVSPQSNSQQ